MYHVDKLTLTKDGCKCIGKYRMMNYLLSNKIFMPSLVARILLPMACIYVLLMRGRNPGHSQFQVASDKQKVLIAVCQCFFPL